jgi:hypothetical protein
MEKLIAYCGSNCAECGAYVALKTNDQALREKTAVEWTKMHNFTFTPDMINCMGCKGDGVKICHCSVCDVRKCASEKGVATCTDCTDFKTCKIISDFNAYVAQATARLCESV